MPINPYTGKEIVDAYTPYSTESGATPLVRKLTPEKFGSSPDLNQHLLLFHVHRLGNSLL